MVPETAYDDSDAVDLLESALPEPALRDAAATVEQTARLVCEMLARYEFGDLRYTTKKEFKNLRKKTQRKQVKRPATHLQVKRGPTIVSFD